MNIIHVVLLVGIWLVTIAKGKQYFQLRDAFIRSGESEMPTDCKNSKKVFISGLVTAIIYTLIKLCGL